uniref:Putative membrane protein insertion efficiency factor n=1 Tax=candidate division WOR-3 bacterium TaxID=2052148 RepID=A0A7C3NHF9_UNCW3
MNKIVIFFIQIYRKFISPLFPPTCRFTPTCSEYSLQAYKKYNFFKASFLSAKRILRCNPFSKGGEDPLE